MKNETEKKNKRMFKYHNKDQYLQITILKMKYLIMINLKRDHNQQKLGQIIKVLIQMNKIGL